MIKRCYINTLLVISGLILLTGIIFFLWNTDIFKFKDAIDSEKFGQFGDYIGGILGTVFAGSGFILLILTYRLQSDENRINHQNSDLSYLNNLYSEIISDINSITFTAERKLPKS